RSRSPSAVRGAIRGSFMICGSGPRNRVVSARKASTHSCSCAVNWAASVSVIADPPFFWRVRQEPDGAVRAGLDPPAGFDQVGGGGRGDDGRAGHGQPRLKRVLVEDGGFHRALGAGKEAAPRPGRPRSRGPAVRRGGVELDRLALD